MQVLNQKMMTTCRFEDYVQIPAWSYSGIKMYNREPFVPTEKMKLGTHVHNYLLTPKEYKYDDIAIVKPIATQLKLVIGEKLFQYFQPELVVTADYVHEGFKLRYKGRIDLPIVSQLVIDIKVTEMNVHKFAEFFGTDHQLSGYAYGIGAKMALIVAIHPKKLTTQIRNVPIRPDFWEHHIKQKGEPIL